MYTRARYTSKTLDKGSINDFPPPAPYCPVLLTEELFAAEQWLTSASTLANASKPPGLHPSSNVEASDL
ncbi:MAG: hypothetical protein FRX49_12592 [Trebouxia sp. A1-2]|nr:MAG: hypothetical protein FRX49_12592 [Trebouxia sp. A1-2]